MDLNKQFKDLDLSGNIEKEAADIESKNKSDEEKVLAELHQKLAEVKGQPENQDTDLAENEEQEVLDENEKTFFEKVQPFIIPICLTLFAIIFAGLFLYFFSKSRIEKSVNAIVNTGAVEVVQPQQQPVTVIVKNETPTCSETQTLNEAGDTCIDNPAPATSTEPVLSTFEDGTTTVMHVRFSFDKYNYDNSPRGIFLLADQIFEGEFEGFKLNPVNRAFANDYFFGVDRYTVSLIGSCAYVIDDAQILVKTAKLGKNSFSGNVVKVLEASKPYVDCKR